MTLLRPPDRCVHLGEPTGEQLECSTCRGHRQADVFTCRIHGQAAQGRRVPEGWQGQSCQTCVDWKDHGAFPCMWRGERTGETFPCKPCEAEGLSELPIYGCQLYGEALLRRPVGRGVWDGAVCLTCVDRQPE